MADLKDIRGTRVQSVASDLSSPGSATQLFYNTTTNVFKIARAGTAADGSWSSGANLNAGRQLCTSAGSGADNGLMTGGGAAPPPFGPSTLCESYNGTAWTEVADLNEAKMAGMGAGTNTAAIFAGDNSSPTATTNTEIFNGSSWTEVNNLNTARRYPEGAGLSTAALLFSGISNTNVESWDGTNWTEVGDLNTAKNESMGTGRQTTAISFGNGSGNTEIWDGSSWTEVSDMNTGRNDGGGAGVSNTSALGFGGREPSASAKTESWDGSSWTEVGDLPGAIASNVGAGSASSAWNSGGSPGVSATSEWAVATIAIKSITSS